MSMLPLTFSAPVARIMRCPRLLEIASEQFNIDLMMITDAFYDMVELSIIQPNEFPPFNWFIISEDADDPEMIWFLSETNIQLAVKLDEEDGLPLADRTPSNVTASDMDTITSLTTTINNAIRTKYNDDSLMPILKDIPTKNNNYLFTRPGLMVGEFKFNEDDEYQPFILEQIDSENHALYMSDEEFLIAYCERAILNEFGPDFSQYKLLLDSSIADEVDSVGQINGKFKFTYWDSWEEFTILHDPDDHRDYDCLIPVIAIRNFVLSHISDALNIQPKEIDLCELPLAINNYYSVNNSETMYVGFRYNNELKAALISSINNEDGEYDVKVEILENINENND